MVIYSIMSAQNWAPVVAAFKERYLWIQVESVDQNPYEVFGRYATESAAKARWKKAFGLK